MGVNGEEIEGSYGKIIVTKYQAIPKKYRLFVSIAIVTCVVHS